MSHDIAVENTHEFDDEFLEWEERDDSVPYLAHCIGNSYCSSSRD